MSDTTQLSAKRTRVQLSMGEVKPYFRYTEIKNKRKQKRTVVNFTIEEAGSKRLLVTAEAVLNPMDRFCKATGRRIALFRAIQLAGFNRPDRAALFEWYWQNHRDLKQGLSSEWKKDLHHPVNVIDERTK